VRFSLLLAALAFAAACSPPHAWSPLSEAVGRNDVAAMKRILETTPLSADNPHELMMWAARNGAGHAIALLAGRGVDVNERDTGRNHWTPLQHAIHTQQPGAVRVLLEWGADPDATQPGGVTPLFMAADSTDPTMLQLLLDAGADVHFTEPGGRTALTQAVSGGALWDVTDRPLLGGCRTRSVRALVAADPALRVPQRTKAWKAAVWWARMHDCTEVLSLVGAWPTRTAADKIVTTGGIIKDALGVRSPKDILAGRH
jgi:hypothetical protein